MTQDSSLPLITTTAALTAFCAQAADAPYVTIDTEFLRERTYYAKLCLLQMALPGADGPTSGPAVLVDPLAEGLDLAPFYALMRDESVVKVLHAARRDLGIFCISCRCRHPAHGPNVRHSQLCGGHGFLWLWRSGSG